MKKNRRIRWIALLACLCAVFLALGLYNEPRIQRYEVDAEQISNPIRIALIADLHSCQYGNGGSELIDLLDGENPQLVMLAGDIFDDDLPDDSAASFLEKLSSQYPCYYVTGNHEYWSGADAFEQKMQILANLGIARLSAEIAEISVGGETIHILGVDDPDATRIAPGNQAAPSFEEQLAALQHLSDSANLTILLSHRPEFFPLYAQAGFDLVLCGHAHGGQWRIPGLINGVFAPGQGFLPKYAGGKYTSGQTTMIVSRGLARESTRIPRFYNRPEIVIVDLY